ncbi:uncharacterized protein LOC117658784 [Pantherophis guttatus]|uniref:Uncharacterized protein LOC117658784 n=1 Tax=Pantherophis guttatus TaxID=94885 RepID=A0ABM3YY22_PANGU|nr:uncharacterized protein LOC117658784 [Pantherophis guttatus]
MLEPILKELISSTTVVLPLEDKRRRMRDLGSSIVALLLAISTASNEEQNTSLKENKRKENKNPVASWKNQLWDNHNLDRQGISIDKDLLIFQLTCVLSIWIPLYNICKLPQRCFFRRQLDFLVFSFEDVSLLIQEDSSALIGVQCQDQLIQKPVEVIKEGEDSTIACQFSSSNVHFMHWYRQNPGEGPAFLLTVSLMGFEKHGHFNASFEKEKESQFNITKVKMKDAVVYFCGAQDPQQH